MPNDEHPLAIANRRIKVLAMVAAIDRNFIRQTPRVDPFDQAGKILLASQNWDDGVWLLIAKKARLMARQQVAKLLSGDPSSQTTPEPRS